MDGCALHDATHDNSWDNRVSGHGEGFFPGAERKDEEVGENMRAYDDCWEKQRDEAVEEQWDGVVGEETQAEWRAGLCVSVVFVALGEPAI